MPQKGNGIQVSLAWGTDGQPGIMFMIPASTFIETLDGEPHPGIVMSSAHTREVAYALLLHAQQLDNGVMPAFPPAKAERSSPSE
jgi:hypothetical protein